MRRKLLTITVSATSNPTETMIAATTTLARAAFSRSERAPSVAATPNRRAIRDATHSTASVHAGASSEKPATTRNAATKPPAAQCAQTLAAVTAAAMSSTAPPATPSRP